jgi:hypothetical protein
MSGTTETKHDRDIRMSAARVDLVVAIQNIADGHDLSEIELICLLIEFIRGCLHGAVQRQRRKARA